MYIEEYIEDDEEPPLLLSPRPSHSKCACLIQRSRRNSMLLTVNSSLFCVLKVFGCGGTAAVQCRWEDGCVCLQCPAGQEPSKVRR